MSWKQWLFIPVGLLVILLATGCMPNDLQEPFYAPDVLPNANNTGSVGSTTMYWANGYFTNINGAPYAGGGVPALTDAHIFVGSALNVATDKAVTGDLSLANTGAFTVTGIQGHQVTLPMSSGYLYYDTGASSWAFSNPAGVVASVTASSPLASSGGANPDISLSYDTGTLDVVTGNLAVKSGVFQASNSSLTSLSGLSYVSDSFVKMTGANTFTLDTNTYLTSVTAHNLLSATHGDTVTSSPVLGGIIYANSTPAWAQLSGDTTNTRKFLRTLSVAGVAQAPAWDTVTKTDVGLGSVENTALSTWAGTSNIITLGTITTGTWSGTTITPAKGGTGVANGANNTITFTGNYTLGITLSNNTSVTFPTSGTLSTLTGSETLTNKTLASPNVTVSLVAGETVNLGDACYIKSDGKAWKAKADSDTTMPAVLIATSTITVGNTGNFVGYGYVTNPAWSFTAGQYCYVSNATSGLVVNAYPNTSGSQVQVVGIAITSTQIYWNPNPMVLTLQ